MSRVARCGPPLRLRATRRHRQRRLRRHRRRVRQPRSAARRPVHRAEGRGDRRAPLRRQGLRQGAARCVVDRAGRWPACAGRRHDRRAGRAGRAPRARGRAGRSSASPDRSARPAPRRRCSPRSTARSRGDAHRSVKSYNNHTGVPLSLARMPRTRALRRVRDGHEPCRRTRRADPAGAPARRDHHRDRAGAYRNLRRRKRRSPTPRARFSRA